MNVEYKDEAGNTLNWPLQYSTSVTRLTVHHTTTDLKHLKDPAGAVRSIYYFHTVTRGWGDLGYHYLIAPDGTIYKGRYGEDNVVAAHASGYNVGNVGIVLIGPYHREPVEGAAFDSLLKLLMAKAEEHEIDIDATSPYKGVEVDNLIGHQDVGGTLCPGIHMYEHLDELRAILGAEQDMKTSANYTVGTDLIVLDPQEAQRVEISIQNLSDTSWNGKTYFEVEAVTDARFLAQYPQETLSFSQSVAPGANGKLAWPLKSDWDAGLTAFKITPYWNGLVQDEAFLVPVFVQEPFVNFEVLDLTYPQVASEGTSFTVRAEIKNVGNFTWNHPAHPESSIQIASVDAAQVGLDDAYLSVATLATITQTVEVGETVMVEWEVDAAQLTQGQQFFHAEMPEVESSISSRLHHLTVWTNPESQEISIVNKGEARVFQVGKAIGGWIQFTNHTNQSLDLTQNDLHWVGTVHSQGGLIATDLETSFALKVLEPGMSTRLYFRLTAPDETGEYQIDWMPMQGGFEIWTTPLIYDFAIENG